MSYRWVAGVVLGLLGVCVSIGNWRLVFRWLLRGMSGSFIPVVGGGSGALAVWWFSPFSEWWWVPLAFDPGCFVFILGPLFWLGGRVRRWFGMGADG